jgi:hypothetical protein
MGDGPWCDCTCPNCLKGAHPGVYSFGHHSRGCHVMCDAKNCDRKARLKQAYSGIEREVERSEAGDTEL